VEPKNGGASMVEHSTFTAGKNKAFPRGTVISLVALPLALKIRK
jgi:hypothetical protein